jgi:hypothetical protein
MPSGDSSDRPDGASFDHPVEAPSPERPDPSEPTFTARLSAAWDDTNGFTELALIPLLAAFLRIDNVAAVLAFEGFHLGVSLGFPTPIIDVWSFVSPPSIGSGVRSVGGVAVDAGGSLALAPALALVPVLALVRAAITAGYLGSIVRALRTGEYDFAASARRHFVPLVGYEFAVLAVGLSLVVVALAFGTLADPLVILAIPAYFVLAYLFYAAPYLIVLRDTGLRPALRGSYRLAIDGGPYARFAAAYAAFVALVSIAATVVVVNLGLAGVVLGAAFAAPLGLAANTVTMRFVSELDSESPGIGFESRP